MVLDSNVLISSFFWRGNEYEILRKALEGKFELLISGAILAEIENVLDKKFGVQAGRIKETVELIIANSTVIEPKSRLNVIRDDESDNRILECAVEGAADYIVTGDKHLLKLREYRRTLILGSENFLKIIS